VSGWRNTALLGGLLAVLAAYFYFFEADKKTEEEVDHVFDIKMEEVTRVKVTTEGGSTTIEKVPMQGWQIVEPILYPADAEALSAVLSELAGLTFARTVADSVASLAEYGLNPPRAAIEVGAGLAAPNVLLLGDANPTGSSHYAAAQGTGRVFLISNETNNKLRKTVNGLRDRRLIHVDQDRVNELAVQTGRYTLMCRLDSLGTWRVHAPFQMPAERNEAINLVTNVTGIKALEFVDDRPASLSAYGLDRPAVTATVKSRDGSVNATILLGKTEGDRIYALSSERPTVYKVSSHVLDQVDRDPELFRRKTAFDFRSYDVPKVRMQIGGESISLVKRSFDDWRIVEPETFRANDREITALLDSLEVMKIKEYLPATPENVRRYGLDNPPVKLTLTVEKRSIPQEVLVGAASEDGTTVYVRDPLESWIYAVNATGLKNIPPTALDLRDRKMLRFKGYEVNMFEVVEANRRVRVRRDQKEKTVWRLEEPVNQNANAITVGRAFSVLDSLYTEAFITNDPDANLAPFGLDKPSMEITLLIGGRDNVPEERLTLLVGKPFPGDNRLIYVKRRDNPAVSLVKSDFVKHLKTMISNTPMS
jgi:hypothetical protein